MPRIEDLTSILLVGPSAFSASGRWVLWKQHGLAPLYLSSLPEPGSSSKLVLGTDRQLDSEFRNTSYHLPWTNTYNFNQDGPHGRHCSEKPSILVNSCVCPHSRWAQSREGHSSRSCWLNGNSGGRLLSWQDSMFPGTMTQIYTLQVQELLVDSTPCNGDVISPSPYISDSLTADVCEINSTVFPNLGSMTHSKVSGWLCVMQKQNCEKKQASRKYTSILRDKTWGEFGFTYCSVARDVKTSCDRCYCEPYIHISKYPAGTYTFHILEGGCTRCYTSLETHRRPKPNINCFGSSCVPSMKRSGRKDSGSSYISGFLLSPLRNILKRVLCQMRIGEKRKGYRP